MKNEAKSRGGKNRAKSLSAEERKDIASQAASRRWEKERGIPRATHRGEVRIADALIPCAVLDDGRRILSETAVNALFGSSGGKNYRLRAKDMPDGPLPLFVASKALRPHIAGIFGDLDLAPVEYRDGRRKCSGYPAEILPKVCEVWLRARDANDLQKSQIPKAIKADVLMRGLAQVGIVALVDEATGYQDERARDALSKILEEFIAKELQPWVSTFQSDFYENLFRLRGVPYDPSSVKRPAYFGHLTNDIVYDRLAPGVREELARTIPRNKDGKPTAKFFQKLTSNKGYPKLKEHLGKVVAYMQLSDDYPQFLTKLDKFLPRFEKVQQLSIDFEDDGKGL